ncbi:hypothetical protein NYR55_09530 [Sphingomonas sp. BGYR3]|uniref:hypothetical protein n=1 Tax=Sphingomonas sp. BGYR3 TaxID=2975483 RepID=UPI0021A7462C|nr:hypothetical protein [Sphingomonas sp. BGYR3]MDG5488854.1 hypothetical protein [Sphingomonas sp. BGYR3]
MANPSGKCVVCGEGPTVKAHLFPRALMLDIRDDTRELVEGSRHRTGIRYRQNGPWDDRYLCSLHETQCGAGDDYFVRFARRLERDAVPLDGRPGYKIANPRPDKLLHFAYAMVWRQVVCPEGQDLGLNLGPYRALLEAVLFNGAPATLELLIGRSSLMIDGTTPARIAIAPYRQKLMNRSVWHFEVAGLQFFLKTDKRAWPAEWARYLANGNDPLYLAAPERRDLASAPLLQDIFAQMLGPE